MPYPLALLALLFPLSFATPPGGGNCFAHFMNEGTVAAQLAKGDGIETWLCPLLPTRRLTLSKTLFSNVLGPSLKT